MIKYSFYCRNFVYICILYSDVSIFKYIISLHTFFLEFVPVFFSRPLIFCDLWTTLSLFSIIMSVSKIHK